MESGLSTPPFLTHRDRIFSKMLCSIWCLNAFANSAKSRWYTLFLFLNKSMLAWYYFIADIPREKVPHMPRIKERTVRNNSKERIIEELSSLSTKPSPCGPTCTWDSFIGEDFLLLLNARLCLTCRSSGLILEVNPIPATAKVKNIVSVKLGGMAQKRSA